jgi:hypothetical protein
MGADGAGGSAGGTAALSASSSSLKVAGISGAATAQPTVLKAVVDAAASKAARAAAAAASAGEAERWRAKEAALRAEFAEQQAAAAGVFALELGEARSRLAMACEEHDALHFLGEASTIGRAHDATTGAHGCNNGCT